MLHVIHDEMMSRERFSEVVANDCRWRGLGITCGEPKQDEQDGQGASTTHDKWSIHVANIEKSVAAVMRIKIATHNLKFNRVTQVTQGFFRAFGIILGP